MLCNRISKRPATRIAESLGCIRPYGIFVSFLLTMLLASACDSRKVAEPDRVETGNSNHGWFKDEREKLGVDFAFHSGHKSEFLFPEIVGGGGGLVDFDNDGFSDLIFVQGGLLDRTNDQRYGNQLYRNLNAQRMVQVAGQAWTADHGYGMGVAVGDYDGDGFADMYITNVGPNVLLRNNGDGTFEDVTEMAGVGDANWGTSVAFLDVNGDGHPDLYVCNYVDWSLDGDVKCFKNTGQSDYCSPQSYNKPAQDVLYVNRGDGTFLDATRTSGISTGQGNGLGVVVADFDGNGAIDIFVANDMSNNLLWMNDGSGNFKNQAIQMGCAVDRDGQVKAGMGTCVADLSGNGLADILVVNLVGQSDSFYENRGKYFVDTTAQRGLALHSRALTRFGVGLHDFNLNGDLDIFIANGRVTLPDKPIDGDAFAEPNLVMRGSPNGTFAPVASHESGDAAKIATSRAAIFGDINNDGRTNVVIVNRDAQANVLLNQCVPSGNWIGLDIRDASGRLIVGPTISVSVDGRSMRREVNPHYSYLSSNDHRILFYLGMLDQLPAIEVRWLGRDVRIDGPFEVNRYHIVHLGER